MDERTLQNIRLDWHELSPVQRDVALRRFLSPQPQRLGEIALALGLDVDTIQLIETQILSKARHPSRSHDG